MTKKGMVSRWNES